MDRLHDSNGSDIFSITTGFMTLLYLGTILRNQGVELIVLDICDSYQHNRSGVH